MKKLLYSFALLGIFATTACTEEDGSPAPANAITYNGQSYKATTGVIIDGGPINLTQEAQDSHYNYTFSLTDATTASPSMSYILMGFLNSPGIDQFKTGTFNWYNIEEYTLEDVQDKSVFMASLILDGNNDGVVNPDVDPMLMPTGGKVIVSGAGTKYNISFNLTFEGGKTLKGSYAGEFVFMDADEVEPEAAPAGVLKAVTASDLRLN